MKPIVAIVGRPNVGKSTLFNRITGKKISIIEDTPGVTRDRIYYEATWNGREMLLVDTGGIEPKSDDEILRHMRMQAQIAIASADVIILMCDLRAGLTADDSDIATMLLKSGKPVIPCVNKVDSVGTPPPEFYEFYGLGFKEEPIPISSVHGNGTGDLLDRVVSYFPQETEESGPEQVIGVAVIGKPNAGKSSIINAFIGEERNIVTEIAGTTRDSIYTRYNKFGFDFYLVDTAGIRRKSKVNEDIEYYSVIRSIRAIENSDVCILMIDATRGIENQDANIFSLIQRNNKGLVVCVNKWDLVENKSVEAIRLFENAIRNRFAPFTDFPIIFGSALTKQRIYKVLETAVKVYENRNRKIATSPLNNYMQEVIAAYPPPANKGKYVKIKYVTMLKEARIPSFVFFCNLPQWVKEPYRRYLENKIREQWDFSGTPINIFMREK